MLKILKYIFVANLYKKAKKSFVMLFIYVVALILLNLIFDDILSITTGAGMYILLLTKWVVILSLLSLIGFSILKIINVATNTFEVKKEQPAKDMKKDRILAKEKLLSKSDLILQKYITEKKWIL